MSLLLCIIIKSQLLIYTNENKNKQQFLYKVKNTPKKKNQKCGIRHMTVASFLMTFPKVFKAFLIKM